MNIPGEGGVVGESIGGGGWCFGAGLGSLWGGGAVANWQCVLWHSNSNSECVHAMCKEKFESSTLLDLY